MLIGMAGLGRMGAAMALRLRDEGHDLLVWNRSPDKLAPLVAAGAAAVASPAELAGRADAIVTSLTDRGALDAVYRGPGGVLDANLSGKLVVEMSTVRPEDEIALAGDVAARGAAFVECPVGGTTAPARAGKLIGLVGGTEAGVARARPILDALCRRVEHVGPVGAGASLKLAINLPLLVFYQALGEALTLTRHLGLDPGWAMDFFADTAGGANVLKVRGPAIAAALRGEEPATAFDVGSIRKDLRTMVAEAASRGASLPLAERTLAVYDEASRAGWDDRDGATLPSFWPGKTPASWPGKAPVSGPGEAASTDGRGTAS